MGYSKISLIYILMYFLGILVILSKEHKVVIVNTYMLGNSKCFWSTELSVMTLNEEKKGDEVILISMTASVCRTRI